MNLWIGGSAKMHETFMRAVRISCEPLNEQGKAILEISETPGRETLLFAITTPGAKTGVGVLISKPQIDDLRMVLYEMGDRLIDGAPVKGATRGIVVGEELPRVREP